MINVGKFYKYWIAEALSDDAEVLDEILTKSSAFIMSCMFIKYANDHQYLQERLTTTQEARFNLYLDVGFDTVGCANDHLDETPQAYYSSIYERFYRYAANKECDVQEIYEYALAHADDIDRYLHRVLTREYYKISYTTLADCISTIRSTDHKTQSRTSI